MTGVLRKLAPESLRLLRAALAYRTSPIAAANRYWDLYRRRSFAPDEIHFFGLLNPALTPGDLQKVVSKEELVRLQMRLNDPAFHVLTEDKMRFHTHCLGEGLPVPRIFALYGNEARADEQIRVLHDARSIDAFLAGVEVDALIFKPVSGVNGEGITRLVRSGVQWLDGGKPVSGSSLVQTVNSSSYPRWMFQQLVPGHPALQELSATTGLQTVRVITAVEADGHVRILAMRLRLICGDVPFDNFNYGTTGNVIANVDLENGRIFSVVSNDRGVMRHIESHPRTGVRLLGYEVPQWEAVKALAERTAKSFLPLKTVGWDIAIALPEPCLIEGNVTWGILSGEPRLGDIYRYLETLQ